MNTSDSAPARALRLDGALDVYTVDAIRQRLLDDLTSHLLGAIDLAAVTACDLAGAQLLIAARLSARARGLDLPVLHPPPSLQETWSKLGLPADFFSASPA